MIFNRPEVVAGLCAQGLAGCRWLILLEASRQQGIDCGIPCVYICRPVTACSPMTLPPAKCATRSPMVRGPIGRVAAFPLDHRMSRCLDRRYDRHVAWKARLRVVQVRRAACGTGGLSRTTRCSIRAVRLRGSALQETARCGVWRTSCDSNDLESRLSASHHVFADLAHQIGTNQNKLKAVFKEVFGVTMAEYCLERRMREAQQLLLEATPHDRPGGRTSGHTNTRAVSRRRFKGHVEYVSPGLPAAPFAAQPFSFSTSGPTATACA